MFVVLL